MTDKVAQENDKHRLWNLRMKSLQNFRWSRSMSYFLAAKLILKHELQAKATILRNMRNTLMSFLDAKAKIYLQQEHQL